ncbi:MAG: sialate O-acetylesterase [Phycisphaerae bacterium]|nr:sialate O-acetylesterase [Phycisphaerae bacterium]
MTAAYGMCEDIIPFTEKGKHMSIKKFARCAAVVAVVGLLLVASNAVQAGDGKLRVFILAGQSNMVGHANAHTMATLFNADGAKDKQLAELVFKKDAKISKEILDRQLARAIKTDEITGGISNKKIKAITDPTQKAEVEGKVKALKAAHDAYKKDVVSSSVVSDRVYISSIADGNIRSGKLSVGFGGSDSKIGPEYSFGLSIAKKIDGPVLIIKSSWGGKSLNYDFRPPSAGPYELDAKQKAGGKADAIKKNAGHFYRLMNEQVRKVLKDLKTYHPAYDPKAGHEIAGFVWFQGFNDQFSPAFRDNYKTNMISFIKDLRKEYKTPGMPFIVGVLGTSQTKEKVAENAVSVGQRQAAKAPEFKGNVLAVESYTEYALDSLKVYKTGWADHYCQWDTVGSDRPYHYLGSGKFFVRLGDAFATATADLISKQRK